MNQWIGETFESSTTTQNESFTQNISFVAVDIACHWLQSCGLATSALFPASAPYIEAHSDYWTLIKRQHQPPLDNIFSHSVLAPLLGTRSRYASLGVCFLTSWSLLISNYKFCHGMCAWLPVKIYQKYLLFHFYLTLCIPTEDAQGSLLAMLVSPAPGVGADWVLAAGDESEFCQYPGGRPETSTPLTRTREGEWRGHH